jgi:adenylate cyclase
VAITLVVLKEGEATGRLSISGPTEIGRREESDPSESLPVERKTPEGRTRWVIADLDARRMPRKVCLIEPIDSALCKITNIHSSNRDLYLTDGSPLLPGESRELDVPGQLVLPENFIIHVRAESAKPSSNAQADSTILAGDPEDPWNQAMQSILGDLGGKSRSSGDLSGEPLRTLTGYSVGRSSDASIEAMDVSTVLGWIEQAIAALQCPVTSPHYFSGIAQTVARIIDLDRAEIVLWDGKDWDFSESRRYVRPGLPYDSDPPSESLLRKALETKQLVIYPHPGQGVDSISTSLMDLHTAIASPILDVLDDGKQILGVLYAARRRFGNQSRPATVLEPEQKLVAILSTAVASSIARMKREGLVTKYQQFFSPKVTQAISQNPALLEGEDAEVSVLFCDIRGFSKAADAIGPKAAMNWISDTLSELSSIVLESDGVLVDYVGDEMFAMWGAPEKSFEHAFRATMAAQTMMSLRKKLSERYADQLPCSVDFGIGVCTGPARVGNTGSRQKFKYGPMGRTVNLGSRIQGLTKQWSVSTLLDEATAAFLPADMPIRRLCRAQVVGMDGDIGLYELMSEEIADAELILGYSNALALFETGTNVREAVRAFGELVQRFPNDGPSLIMLVRSVNALVHPSPTFSPIWTATSK